MSKKTMDKKIMEIETGLTVLFKSVWNELNGKKFIEIFGEKTGERLANKYFDFYEQDFLRFWLYLTADQRKFMVKNLCYFEEK